MIKTNYHTHCYLCGHAQGLPIDYIKRSLEYGYQEIGISDHGPLIEKWTYRMDYNSFYNIYLKNIDQAISKYSNQIKIYKGLELEYLEEYNKHYESLLKDLDYIILGQHIVSDNGKLYDIFKIMTDDMVRLYKDSVIKAMKTNYFKILAHPDIFMFKYHEWNEVTEKNSREIIESAIENNVFLEINCNGIRRGRFKNKQNEDIYIYPRIEFWRLVSQYPKAKVIIGEDNHALKHIDDYACIKAREFADGLGLKVEYFLYGESNE